MAAAAVGKLVLNFLHSKYLIIRDVYYVPDFEKNLVSISRLMNDGFSLTFNNDGIDIFRNDLIICKAVLFDNLFYLKPIIPTALNIETNTLEHRDKKLKMDKNNSTYQWHLHLGHIGLDRIKRLVRDGPLQSIQVDDMPTFESCLEGKMTKRSFNSKGNRAIECLELIHSDVCGPFNIQARGGYEYLVTFTDDYSCFGHIYLMRHKSETFNKFK